MLGGIFRYTYEIKSDKNLMKTRLAQIHFDAQEIAQEYELITKHKQTKKKKRKRNSK